MAELSDATEDVMSALNERIRAADYGKHNVVISRALAKLIRRHISELEKLLDQAFDDLRVFTLADHPIPAEQGLEQHREQVYFWEVCLGQVPTRDRLAKLERWRFLATELAGAVRDHGDCEGCAALLAEIRQAVEAERVVDESVAECVPQEVKANG